MVTITTTNMGNMGTRIRRRAIIRKTEVEVEVEVEGKDLNL